MRGGGDSKRFKYVEGTFNEVLYRFFAEPQYKRETLYGLLVYVECEDVERFRKRSRANVSM